MFRDPLLSALRAVGQQNKFSFSSSSNRLFMNNILSFQSKQSKSHAYVLPSQYWKKKKESETILSIF